MAKASCSIVAQLASTSVKAWLHTATRRSLRWPSINLTLNNAPPTPCRLASTRTRVCAV